MIIFMHINNLIFCLSRRKDKIFNNLKLFFDKHFMNQTISNIIDLGSVLSIICILIISFYFYEILYKKKRYMGSQVCGMSKIDNRDFETSEIITNPIKQGEQNITFDQQLTPLYNWLESRSLDKNSKSIFSNKPVQQQPKSQNYSLTDQIPIKQETLTQIKTAHFKKNLPKNHPLIQINFQNFIKCNEAKLTDYYQIIEQIGQGSFGTVFKAKCKITGQLRAIKTIKKQVMNHGDKRQFLAELDLLKKLDHPNIVKLYEVLHWKQLYYVIMQYCEGGEVLKVIARKTTYSQYIIAIIMKQLLSAIAYINNKGIVHRDIKLQNMVFQKSFCQQSHSPSDFKIKIIDFGLTVDLKTYRQQRIIQRAGTKPYMSPQALQGFCSYKNDSWSCGIIMILLLTGKNPFFSLTGPKMKKVDIFADNIWTSISPQAKGLVRNLLNIDIKSRMTAQQALKQAWITQKISFLQQNKDQANKEVLNNLANFYRGDNFVAVVQSFLTFKKITQKERQELAELFQKFDKDGSGMIDKQQLILCYAEVAGQQNMEEVQTILREADCNNSGKIDFSQFITAIYNKKQLFQAQTLKQAFQYYDIDKSGFLQKKQLKQLLAGSPKGEIIEMFKSIDEDSDNKISFKQFVKYLQKYY